MVYLEIKVPVPCKSHMTMTGQTCCPNRTSATIFVDNFVPKKLVGGGAIFLNGFGNLRKKKGKKYSCGGKVKGIFLSVEIWFFM